MQSRARVTNGQIVFTSDYAETLFKQRAEGKDLIITVDESPSKEIRGFFEGAVIPFLYWQSLKSGWTNYAETREALLMEFLPKWVIDLKGQRQKSRVSSAALSRVAYKRLVNDVLNWMADQGYELPDAEDYKKWRDSAPLKGEEYPPLARLKLRAKNLGGTI